MNDLIDKAINDIRENHLKIIDDWCKAYMSQIYQEKGSIKPGDFILNEQESTFHKGENCMAKKYWFELKSEDFKSNHPHLGQFIKEDGVTAVYETCKESKMNELFNFSSETMFFLLGLLIGLFFGFTGCLYGVK